MKRYTGLDGSFGWRLVQVVTPKLLFPSLFLRFWLDLLSVTPFWIRVIHGGHILPHWERFQMLCSLVKQGFSVVLGQGLLRVFKIFRSEP